MDAQGSSSRSVFVIVGAAAAFLAILVFADRFQDHNPNQTKNAPSPGHPPTPTSPTSASPEVGLVAVRNYCTVVESKTVMVNALVEGTYRKPNGQAFKNTTLYNFSCGADQDWRCEGVSIKFREPDADGRRTLGFLDVNPISVARVESVQNGLAVLKSGVATYTVDVRSGTFEHRDASGSGKARCGSQ